MINAENVKTAEAIAVPAEAGEIKKSLLKEIGAKWVKLGEEELSSIGGTNDLVDQLVAKYGTEKGQAHRDVKAFLNGRHF